MDFEKARDLFLDTIRRSTNMVSAASLLYWDMDTIMPKKAGPARAEVLGSISTEVFRLSTSKQFGEAMETLRANTEKLDKKEQRMLEEAWHDYDRMAKIPAELFEEYSVAQANATQLWKKAKDENNYELFAPQLQKLIDYKRDFAERWGYEDKPYDALLEEYDPALLTAQIDPVFQKLLVGTRELLAKVPKDDAASLPSVAADKQHAIGEYLLRAMGYDMDAGNLYTTEHPFTCGIHAGDTRVTTKYHVGNPLSSIFSVLHEGGHGMYDQNVSDALRSTNLYQGTSMGIHESQSRFWENIVGRSLAFWETHLPRVNELAGTALAPDAQAFFRRINHVERSLIRIEADELTYNLHIIIRYELEKAIFNDGVNADALPELWADKYEEYLGVRPQTYTEGILQDSHWSGGSYGYFPSYTIGNLYSAQFAQTLQAQVGPLDELVRTADGLQKIHMWLVENIYQYGKLKKPEEILMDVTGERLSPDAFLAYMAQKLEQV